MARIKQHAKYNVVALKDYPLGRPMLYAGRNYILCAKLEIGYFALASGRLMFLPADQEGTTYKIHKEWGEP